MQSADIYAHLLAGKTLTLRFPNKLEAEKFRVTLSKFKARQEAALIKLGYLEQEDVQILSLKYVDAAEEPELPGFEDEPELAIEAPSTEVTVLIRFKPKPERITYTVISIDDE